MLRVVESKAQEVDIYKLINKDPLQVLKQVFYFVLMFWLGYCRVSQPAFEAR